MMGPGSVSIKSDFTRIKWLAGSHWLPYQMVPLSFTTRGVDCSVLISVTSDCLPVTSSCLLQIFSLDILSSFVCPIFRKSFAIIRLRIKIVVKIAFAVYFIESGLSWRLHFDWRGRFFVHGTLIKFTGLIHIEVLDTFSLVFELESKTGFSKTFILHFLKIEQPLQLCNKLLSGQLEENIIH